MSSTATRATFPALGGVAAVAVTDAAGLATALDAVQRTVDEFDLACSRFRPDSELSRLNAAAGSETVVSPVLFEALSAAIRAAEVTGGDVDPTVGGALIALGYDRDFEALRPHPPAPRVSATKVPGWRSIELDESRHAVRLRRGVCVDLGATAKALAADRAAERAHRQAGCGVLVSLSGDMALGGEAPADGWLVRVTDDHRSAPDAPGQTIVLRTGGLATSSCTVRRWVTEGGEAHHLLDPGTGRPVAGPWRTVTVSAASCLDANIASTASIVRGLEAPRWLQAQELPSRLVGTGGSVIHVAGWPREGDELVSFAPVGVPA